MKVRIVPQGALRPNPANPFYEETPGERREEMLRSAAIGLARILRREVLDAGEDGGDEAEVGPAGGAPRTAAQVPGQCGDTP
jgi:hypothetical protein